MHHAKRCRQINKITLKPVDIRLQPLNNRREELRRNPNLLLLPLDGQRTRLDLPFLSLKEEQMRHDLRQTAFNLPQIELDLWQIERDPLPMPSDLFQITSELPQIMFCSEQIVAHPPQTRPCLRLISFHGG